MKRNSIKGRSVAFVGAMSTSSISTAAATLFILVVALASFRPDPPLKSAAHWTLRGSLASIFSPMSPSGAMALPAHEKPV